MNLTDKTSYRFRKKERLKSSRTISQLFQEGRSFGRYPLRLVWLSMDKEAVDIAPVQIAFSVPKKKFKSAVDRNRIKRQMREAWRLNKHLLYEQIASRSFTYVFMIIYVGKQQVPYAEIAQQTQQIIQKFVKVSLDG
ncbi:MAG: ribonuclease P protein component [Bacteroidota bacterium]